MDGLTQACVADMKKRLDFLDNELARIRTGRASVSILDGVRVDYYGAKTPLNQIATLATPDARTIVVSPFEKAVLPEIEKAIRVADVGIQPNNDGNVIRLPVPPLNEERRKEIAKNVNKIGEESKVAIRQIRQDYNAKLKRLEKDKEVTEDDVKTLHKEIQDQTDKFTKMVEDKIQTKRDEVMKL